MAFRPYGRPPGPIIAERGCTMPNANPLPGPQRRFLGAGKVRCRPAGTRGSQRPPDVFLGVGDGARRGGFGFVGRGGRFHRGQDFIRKPGRDETQPDIPAPSLLNRRWLITFDHDGRERVTPIDPERFFLKMEELPELIRDPGFMIEWKILVEILHACADRLANKLGGERSECPFDGGARHECGTGGHCLTHNGTPSRHTPPLGVSFGAGSGSARSCSAIFAALKRLMLRRTFPRRL